MMSKIGPKLSSFHPKLDVKSKAAVDELLACEVRMYVIFCIFNVFLHIGYYLSYLICFCIFDILDNVC